MERDKSAEPFFEGGSFPEYRARRMRQSEALRRMVRETRPSPDQFIMPYFVCEGSRVKDPIAAMPGQYRFSTDQLLPELEELLRLGIGSVLLFGIPDQKDLKASSAWSDGGVVQKAARAIKARFPELLVITDVCLCAYMSHGHCGVINEKGAVDNDASLALLAKVARSHAAAGCDMVAPSDMMDGRIRVIRAALDGDGFEQLPIMSYAAKYASAFYGPFRDAAHSAPNPSTAGVKGNTAIPSDRLGYQMDPANRREALREIALDIQEGADIVMVKPALAYLDVIAEAARTFHFPLAAYAVSGEYSMIKAAAEKGMVDERALVHEIMTGLVRAGAQTVITYHAKQIALWNQPAGDYLKAVDRARRPSL